MGRIIVPVVLVLITLTEPACASESDSWQPYIVEASERFGIAENWIRAVIARESDGDRKAVSPKGAMGLMQLMPDTWHTLQNVFALGSNPFDPHDNILAGTAYLRAMYDRFGYPALFTAYNAGPARYEDFLSTGKPLPVETKIYTAKIEKAVSGTSLFASRNAHQTMQMASGAGLFFELTTTKRDVQNAEKLARQRDLFVRLSIRKSEGK